MPYLQALIQPIGYVDCCVGMWMLYGEGMRKNSGQVRTTCYTVMFAGLCALLTGAVLSTISLLLTYVETMEFLAFGDVVISTIVGVVLGGGFAITLFALLTYLVYKSGRSITYRPRSGLLTTTAVFLFIQAGMTLFSHAILQQARIATTTTLVNMLVVVAIILMGTLLISYRNKCYGKNPGK